MALNYQRQSDRYELSSSPENFHCLMTDVASGDGSVGVTLNNISTGGMQLTLPKRVLNGHSLVLQLGSGDNVVSRAVTVRWTVPDHDGWVCGCQFKSPLEASFLDDLARAGVLERRDNLRFDISLICQLRVEGCPEQHTVTVVDYSNGGIGLKVDTAIQIGRKALLEFDNSDGTAVRLFTHVLWCEGTGDVHRAGLRFLRDQDADLFLGCAESLSNV